MHPFCLTAFRVVALGWLALLLSVLPQAAPAQDKEIKPTKPAEPSSSFCQPTTMARRVDGAWKNTFQLNADSIIACRLKDRLSSRDKKGKAIKQGEIFKAYVSQAITDERGMLLIPRNSEIEGQVERVYPAKSGQPAMLEVSFNTLRRQVYPNDMLAKGEVPPALGKTMTNPNRNLEGIYYDEVQLNGEMVSLNQGKGCKELNEDGILVGRRPGSKNTLKYVGAGAGGGAMLAGIAVGSLTATGVGAGIGAGVGLLIALNTRGKEVSLEAGTLFGVRLTTPLRLRSMEQELRYPEPKKNPRPPVKPASGLTSAERGLLNQIDFNLNRIITTHRQYLDTYNQPFSNSLQSLEQLHRHVREARGARARGAAVSGIARVYDASGLTNYAISMESAQATGLRKQNDDIWGYTKTLIDKLADAAKIR